MIRRPPRSTLFPTRRSSDLIGAALAVACARVLGRFRTSLIQRQDELAALSTRLRSEEHTSELQSLAYLVCRLLLEKKKPSQAPCYVLALADSGSPDT